MADKLTAQQRMAVENRGGKLLVSAAAGSGKTKVLVDRLISYLTDTIHPANIDDFLIITYTKAAAAELRGKISAKLTACLAENPGNRHLQRQMQRLYLAKISTVHAFCTDILRQYAYELDIAPDFRVADENECAEIQQFTLEHLLEQKYEEANEDFYTFVDTQGFGRNDVRIADIILKVYNNSRCHLNPTQWLNWCLSGMNTDDLSDASETVWGRYLMDDLFSYLDEQIDVFRKCISRAETVAHMEKPTALFAETLSQLILLRNCVKWDDIYAHRTIDYGRLVFSKKCTDQDLAEQMKSVRNACKKGLDKKLAAFADRSNIVLDDLRISYSAALGLIDLVREFSDSYNARKRQRRVLDFSDLEQRTLDLVLGKQRIGPTTIAREIGQRFREVMVDEYQDTNEVQDSIFAALTSEKNNCFMVGDVKQSIYQFRLADPSIFIDKYHSYALAEFAAEGEGRKVLLSNNFRSSAGVISAVNEVFRNCMSSEVGGIEYGDQEELKEGIPHCDLPEPEVELYGIMVKEDTYSEEASFVANRICELLDGTHRVRDGDKLRPIVPDDIVILLRSPGSVGADFKYALDKKGIRCTTGSGIDLLRTEEVSFLRSLLQIISNPMQDIPLVAVMANRVFGFTANELAQIRGRNKKISFYESVRRCDSGKCRAFLMQLDQLRQEARFCNVPQLIQRIFLSTRMDSIYAAMPDGFERNENLQIFYQLALEFSTVPSRDLDLFLQFLSSMEEKGLMKSEDHGASGAVRIMSIHKSKGLEFPVVFLCGLSRGFNQENLREPVICDKELGLGLNCIHSSHRVRYPSISKRAIAVKMVAEGVSEEMRVLYVAMTRPRDRLIMTYAVKNLGAELSDIVLRNGLTSKALLTKEVNCLGNWVLQAAMQRTEAGAFFDLAGNAGAGKTHKHMWKISVVESLEEKAMAQTDEVEVAKLTEKQFDLLRSSLEFRYPYPDATKTPSKLTATQLKGRNKDFEVSQGASSEQPYQPPSEEHRFVRREVQGKEFGNALHAVMQYISYTSCDSEEKVLCEIERLVKNGLITAEQSKIVDADKIVKFFTTPIGKKITGDYEVIREFKFSLLDSGKSHYSDASDEDQVLLQGVVDCAIVEDDGITVIDFKTDRVYDDSRAVLVERYSDQIRMYGKALTRIFAKPIKALLIYSFHLSEFVQVDL